MDKDNQGASLRETGSTSLRSPEPASGLRPPGDDPARRALEFAKRVHDGQTYQGQPYVYGHVAKVVQILRDFGFRGAFEVAGWLHDVVEDTPTGILEIEREFGDEVADLVHACTGHGHNRKARNRSIYRRLARHPRAAVVKLADRIANVEASAPGSNYRSMYLKEAADFGAVVKAHVPAAMWDRLERALASGLNEYAAARLRGARDRDATLAETNAVSAPAAGSQPGPKASPND